MRAGRITYGYVTWKLCRLKVKPGNLLRQTLSVSLCACKEKKRSEVSRQVFQQTSALSFQGFLGICDNLLVFNLIYPTVKKLDKRGNNKAFIRIERRVWFPLHCIGKNIFRN